jgi:hypothetical protein
MESEDLVVALAEYTFADEAKVGNVFLVLTAIDSLVLSARDCFERHVRDPALAIVTLTKPVQASPEYRTKYTRAWGRRPLPHFPKA